MIMIVASNGDTEKIIEDFASGHKKLSGEGYVSPTTGYKGIMLLAFYSFGLDHYV